MSKLRLVGVNKYYGEGISRVHTLRDADFFAKTEELNLILGPSRSGKSTFLMITGGSQTLISGKVLIDGIDIEKLPSKKRDKLRLQKVGFIPQSYNLLPYLNVADQFKLIDRIEENGNVSSGAFDELPEEPAIKKLLKQCPSELSEGQNQRVAVARALYTNPKIILAGEPTAVLDSSLVKTVGQLSQDLAKKEGKAVIAVTHDLRLREYADNVYKLADGKPILNKNSPDQ